MPSRPVGLGPALSLPFRVRPPAVRWRNDCFHRQVQAFIRCSSSSKRLPISENRKGPNTEQLPHVSEEAASMAKIMGGKGPDLSQGTLVQEVVKGDKRAEEMLPKVMKEDLKASKPSNSRSYSTTAVQRQELSHDLSSSSQLPDPAIIGNGNSLIQSPSTEQQDQPGQKFGLPSLPLPPNRNLHRRYEPIVEQLTGLLIQHGKKGVAQRNVNYILSHLRTSPPPKISPTRPLLPGHPPPSHLPLNPILYLTLAIDSVAPLLRIRSQRGAAGGGVALQIPIPLGLRRRRRTAIMWILAAAARRKNRGSGKNMFAQRIAEELISVVEGRSSVWDQRNGLHKQGVAARANLFFKPRKR